MFTNRYSTNVGITMSSNP